MDKAVSKAKPAPAGISIRNGPVLDEMDVDEPVTNGSAKRKSRTSGAKVTSYKEDTEDSSDAKPLVC